VKYRTTCPSCASVFRLGEDQLAAAGGWVQCSVCGAAFDARANLLLEDGSPLPRPEPVDKRPQVEPAAEAAPEPARPAATWEPAAPEDAPAIAVEREPVPVIDTPRGIAEREAAADLDSIILIDPQLPAPEDPGPMPDFSPAPTWYPPEPVARPSAPPPEPRSVAAEEQDREPARPPPALRRRRVSSAIWAAASAVLVVALLAQLTYFLRDTLASRAPQTRPVLEQMCAALGCTLSLPKDLALLQIVGSDLQTEAPGRLRLTLTLGNRARHAQAWPVLVLTLTDQRNRPLARRSFAPSEYLGDAARGAAGIPPRSEQALNLPLTVRDLAPMGFDLQLRY
jgi:predicted Zn finger-like uncharacterized protein